MAEFPSARIVLSNCIIKILFSDNEEPRRKQRGIFHLRQYCRYGVIENASWGLCPPSPLFVTITIQS